MILDTIQLIENHMLLVNLTCHILIFLGGFYVALHSRVLPTWGVTCLWYIGLCSLLNCLTIFAQLVYGPGFFLSYANIGSITETILNISVAATVLIYFNNTISRDFRGMKKRKKAEDIKI